MSWTQLLTDHLLTTTLAFLLVWAATCFVKRPLVRHVLWGALLVKFLLPPLVPVTIPWPDWSTEPALAPASTVPTHGEHPAALFPPKFIPPAASPVPEDVKHIKEMTTEQPSRHFKAAETSVSPQPLFTLGQALAGLLLLWTAGSAVVLLIAVSRGWRFRLLLARAGTHDWELQAEVNELARRAGIKRPPTVLLVQATVSPMLWAVFRPKLIFPNDLVTALPEAERRALLLHELAHLARRDHWLRKLELLVTLIWWWHPGLWLTRRELHAAEEECCDGWVVARTDAARRPYADALLATLDFLADPRLHLPPAACGMGRMTRLERRLTMILKRPISDLGAFPRTVLALATLAILGTSFTLAQVGNGPRKDQNRQTVNKDEEAAVPIDSEWTPPEHPDPSKILHEAVDDRQAGRYAQALEKQLWYHRHAVEFDSGQSGVRLSFALSDWLELAEDYPPALAAFKKVRDATKQRLYQDKVAYATSQDFQDFHDLESMNEKLGQETKTVEVFRYLDQHHPETAERVFPVAEPALILAKEYQLCGEYLEPSDDWRSIERMFDIQRKFAKGPKFDEHLLRFANNEFINDTTTLIALLVINDRKDEALKIAEKARKKPVSEDFQDEFAKALDQAIAGTVPKPWP